jgi:general secretion pathway protein J
MLASAETATPLPQLQHGFTLLELLVALAVFAIMAAAAYSSLHSILTTEAAVTAEANRLAQVQMAWHFLEQDIEQIVPRRIRDDYGKEQPALQSGGLDDEVLSFTRTGWDNPLGQPRASLQRLAYRLDQGRLLRLYWNTLDRSGPSEPQETLLLDEVQEIKVRFLDDQDNWQEAWPPADTAEEGDSAPALPRAVEISVTLNDWGEITRLFLLLGY